ncbi:MAG TPA: cytochrome c oxidase assembly protein, partial [Actinomycetota bacterium]|nr:cytochrome c oxidase assembly protein [Actinomycetota bacterium]
LMLLGASWPIHDVAEGYLFSVHMVQHILFSLVATPLLILGTPSWMARWLLPAPLMRVFRRIARPLPALAIFNVYLVFSHWPGFVNYVAVNEGAHFLAHFVLVLTAIVMWWPVLSPLSEAPRVSPPAQMLYLFGQTIVPTVPASFLTFAKAPFYSVYANAPRLVASISPTTDQLISGLIMKLGGGLLLWSVIAVLFFRWSSREESEMPDASDWQDLEGQVNRTGIR